MDKHRYDLEFGTEYVPIDVSDIRVYLPATIVLLLIVSYILFWMGRPYHSETSQIHLWIGDVFSPEVSQHVFDWYSFTHIAHGLCFYAGLSFLFPSWSFGTRLLLSVGIEGSWELVENTDYVIEYYRQNTVSVDYAGDTIINSMMDIISMIAGFLWARFSPTWGSVSLFVALEVWLIYWIRDSFLLNIFMFVYPLEFIRQ